jgi:AraC family transcriptional regulator
MELLPNKDLHYSDFKAIFRSYRRGYKMPFHTDPAPRLSIVLFGELEEHTLSSTVRAHPFSIVAKAEAATHRNYFGSRGARLVSIVFEDETFRPFAKAAHLGPWQWFHSWEAARVSVKLLRAIKQEQKEEAVKEQVIQLLAALHPERTTTRTTPPLWLQYVAEKVRDLYCSNLLVQDLAEEAGVHPVYLARAFRKYYGCSVKEYLHRQRLHRSLGQLSAGEIPLAHLACDFGYADQAHFSRIFRREAGMSPGQFRKLVWEVVK